jgi:hypothetical protein
MTSTTHFGVNATKATMKDDFIQQQDIVYLD